MQKEFERDLKNEMQNHFQSAAIFSKQQEQLLNAGSNMDQSFYPSQNLENSKMNLDDLQSFGGKENTATNALLQSRLTTRSLS